VFAAIAGLEPSAFAGSLPASGTLVVMISFA
jgi:hypothetical protein